MTTAAPASAALLFVVINSRSTIRIHLLCIIYTNLRKITWPMDVRFIEGCTLSWLELAQTTVFNSCLIYGDSAEVSEVIYI